MQQDAVANYTVLLLQLQDILNYWIIPVGMIALYYYGRFHFNAVDVEVKIDADSAETQDRRLISLAPPAFTTSRSRFRKFMRIYIFILEAAFLVIVFAWSAVSNAAEVANFKLPEPGDLQMRAIWALFGLTGLLSSFPLFKDVDAWMLRHLQQAALIPGNAWTMAETLYHASYVPDEATVTAVRRSLSMRDTIKVADDRASGSLEQLVLRVLWLRQSLRKNSNDDEHRHFQIKLQKDFQDVDKAISRIGEECRRYLRDQERVVPSDITDIDSYINDRIEQEQFNDLWTVRENLKQRCDALFFRMSLLASLFVNATKVTPEEISETFRNLGFQIVVTRPPRWGANAILLTALGVFVSMITTNALTILIAEMVHQLQLSTERMPSRIGLFIIALLATIQCLLALTLAVKLKRIWSKRAFANPERPDNILIGFATYLITGCVQVLFGLLWVKMPVLDALLFGASQLQQGVVGFFVGWYVDRTQEGRLPSTRITLAQGIIQFLAALIGSAFLLPSPPGAEPTPYQKAFFWTLFSIQAGVAGLVIGGFFQRFYRTPDQKSAAPNAGPATVVGDFAVQPRSS